MSLMAATPLGVTNVNLGDMPRVAALRRKFITCVTPVESLVICVQTNAIDHGGTQLE
jgi:hypothetical protein